MTATQERDEDTLDASINDDAFHLIEPDSDTYMSYITPLWIPLPPLPIAPNHSIEPLVLYPPDDAGSVKANETNLDDP